MSDDLQEVLARPPRPPLPSAPKPSATSVAAVLTGLQAAGVLREATQTAEAAPAEKPAKNPSNLQQWAVLADDTFKPITGTMPILPPGVYDIGVTNQGVFYTKEDVVTDELIDLGDSNSLKIIQGIRKFWTKKTKYAKRGQIFKRGVLLWGPPGSGKTATVTFMMREIIEQGGIVFLVSNPDVLITGLKIFRKIEPDRPIIVVFEDIEEIVRRHGEKDLLSFLDGEHQIEGIVSIGTTNFPEDLGDRIVNRPSRFDEVIKIGMPSDAMRRAYIEHMIVAEDEFPVDQAVKDTAGLSIAHIKELVIAVAILGADYNESVQRLTRMKQRPKSGGDSTGRVGFTLSE